MVDVGMEKVYPVRCESESWLAKARQDTLSRSPDKPSPSRFPTSTMYFLFSHPVIQSNQSFLYFFTPDHDFHIFVTALKLV
jgi:hypothetical protein